MLFCLAEPDDGPGIKSPSGEIAVDIEHASRVDGIKRFW